MGPLRNERARLRSPRMDKRQLDFHAGLAYDLR